MGRDKPESRDKTEKKKKRSELDGVKKHKKEKKPKLNDENLAAAFEEITASAELTENRSNDIFRDGDKDSAFQIPAESLVPFANPLADEKITKKVLKTVKKASKNKTLKRGVKEVVKALRKSQQDKGATSAPSVVVLAADISPMDVISHIPVLCEDHNIPYIFVKSRAELGSAGNTKRPTSVVMVSENRTGPKKTENTEDCEEFRDVYKQLVSTVQKEARKVRI